MFIQRQTSFRLSRSPPTMHSALSSPHDTTTNVYSFSDMHRQHQSTPHVYCSTSATAKERSGSGAGCFPPSRSDNSPSLHPLYSKCMHSFISSLIFVNLCAENENLGEKAASSSPISVELSLSSSSSSNSSSDEEYVVPSSSSDDGSDSKEVKIDLELPRRSRLVSFTCNICGTHLNT